MLRSWRWPVAKGTITAVATTNHPWRSSTTYLPRRAAAKPPAFAASSQPARRDSCCAQPSARLPPPASPPLSYRPRARFQFPAAFLPQKNSPTRRTGPTNWQIDPAADPTPLCRQATAQLGSSPHCVLDKPAARPECGAIRTPSSNSCGRPAARSNVEIPRHTALRIQKKDPRHTPSDRREPLYRGAVLSGRVRTFFFKVSHPASQSG